MSWRRDYPLFCCLLVFNIIGGVLVVTAGAILIDLSFYPESNVQFVGVVEGMPDIYKSTQQQKDEMKKIKDNERALFLFLFILGILCILFGCFMILIGLDIIYTIHVNDETYEGESRHPSAFRDQLESDMRKLNPQPVTAYQTNFKQPPF